MRSDHEGNRDVRSFSAPQTMKDIVKVARFSVPIMEEIAKAIQLVCSPRMLLNTQLDDLLTEFVTMSEVWLKGMAVGGDCRSCCATRVRWTSWQNSTSWLLMCTAKESRTLEFKRVGSGAPSTFPKANQWMNISVEQSCLKEWLNGFVFWR